VKVFILARIPLIAVVDDDLSFRNALAELVEVFDFRCRTFEDAEGFLAVHAP